jgi:hypothetical protein
MKLSDAARLVTILAATGHGWTDVHVETYAHEMAREMDDAAAAEVAVRRIVREWTKTARPPIGVIVAEYRREVERRNLERAGIGPAPAKVPYDDGIAIARQAYADERIRRGRRPDYEAFERWVGKA